MNIMEYVHIYEITDQGIRMNDMYRGTRNPIYGIILDNIDY
jgi:hypothetical protein